MPLTQLRAAASVLMDRLRWATQAGLTFNGRRDLYQVLGYARTLTFYDFYDRYMRDGIAKAVVEAYPTATWRGGVELFEDEDPEVDTEFEKAFKELDARLGVWQRCQQVDIAAGLSTFAVLLIGAAGDVSVELPKGNRVLFLKPYFGGGGPAGSPMSRAGAFEASASIARYDTDPESERFGEPLSYWIRQTNLNTPGFNREVHWSRVIHVAEGTLEDDLFGIPTLQCVFNLFDDLAKLTGGGSEAFWLRANQGLQLDVDPTMGLPGSTSAGLSEAERTALKDKAEELQHQLQRVIVTRGVTATQLGSDVAQFGPSADAILKQIAGAARIPMRILTGSEMGTLASEQDAANFDSRVQDRRTGYAGPRIVRRLVDRLIEYGYLPTPKQYEVGWPVEENLDEDGKASFAVKLATVNQTYGSVVFTPEEIRDMTFDMPPLDDGQKQAIADEAAAKIQQAQDAMGGAPPEGKVAPFVRKVPALKAAEDAIDADDDLQRTLRALEDAIEADDLAAIGKILAMDIDKPRVEPQALTVNVAEPPAPHVTVNMPASLPPEPPTVVVNVPPRPAEPRVVSRRMVFDDKGVLERIVNEFEPEKNIDVDTYR